MNDSPRVRTRFAPSPTGYMHVGNLRTALYAYLAAKKEGGTFILRIEDTDQGRFVEGALDIIYNTLRETGLLWDEGPDIGGAAGPYIQSQRADIYHHYAQILIDRGAAYRCFCEKEGLEESRELQKASGQAPRYDRHCQKLSEREIAEKLSAGVPYVVRQRIPDSGSTTFHDEIFGDITVENASLDDQVLIKADGMPTYNFANVVDDHLMGVTHVIRGTEYLSSAPKYNLLYESFGWEIPRYIHCPPVMKDQSNKLSKRNGDASYQDLVAKGYLKEAVLNYIALLGWSPGGEREIMSLEEMTECFSIYDISKSPAIFDPQKLDYINAEYIRRMTPEQFHQAALPWIRQAVARPIDTVLASAVLQQRCQVLGEIVEQLDFVDALPEYDLSLFVSKKMKTDPVSSLQALQEIRPVLEAVEPFSVEVIHEALFALIERTGVKNGFLLWPLRVAVSGKQFTPGGGIELSALLGRDETLARIDSAIRQLSAVQ